MPCNTQGQAKGSNYPTSWLRQDLAPCFQLQDLPIHNLRSTLRSYNRSSIHHDPWPLPEPRNPLVLFVHVRYGFPPAGGFDLLNCTALSWLYVRTNALPAHSVAAFCAHPQGRIDDAVTQGLHILAGLALGSSVGERGISEK